MDFKDLHPDFVAIEHHIRRAHLERSVAIAEFIASGIDQLWKGLRRLAALRTRRPAPVLTRPLPSR